MSLPSHWQGFDSRSVQVLLGKLNGNNSAVKRNFSVICVTNEFTTLLIQIHQVRNDEHLWCSGSIVSLQTTDRGSIPVRCKNYSIGRDFALIIVTKENTTLLFLFLHDGVEEHRWCSGSIVDFQAIDICPLPVRCRSYNIDRSFPEILVRQELRSLLFSSVYIGIEDHRWGSGSLVALEAIDVCSIPVRWRSYNIDGNFEVLFVTKEYTTLMSSFSSVGIEEHHWCSGSTAHLQAIDMGSIPAWRRRPSLIRTFQENLSSGGFKSIEISTVQIWVDKHRWCSGSIVTFQSFEKG